MEDHFQFSFFCLNFLLPAAQRLLATVNVFAAFAEFSKDA
jgi:hypothetical protein